MHLARAVVLAALVAAAAAAACEVRILAPPREAVAVLAGGVAEVPVEMRVCGGAARVVDVDIADASLGGVWEGGRSGGGGGGGGGGGAGDACAVVAGVVRFRGVGRSAVRLVLEGGCAGVFDVVVAGVVFRDVGGRALDVGNVDGVALFQVVVVEPSGKMRVGADVAAAVDVDVVGGGADINAGIVRGARANLRVRGRAPFNQRAAVVVRLRNTDIVGRLNVLVEGSGIAVSRVRVRGDVAVIDAVAGDVRVELAVSDAGDATERVLVLLLPDREVRVKEDQFASAMSVFTIPDIGGAPDAPVTWRYEALFEGSDAPVVARAEGAAAGFVFRFANRPSVTSLLPSSGAPKGGGFVTVSVGGISANAPPRVFFASQEVKGNDIVSVSDGEIVVRVPPAPDDLFKTGGTVDISVVDATTGLKSDLGQYTYDAGALDVKLIVLQSSYEAETGRILIPFVCNRKNDPTLLATTTTVPDATGPPVYSFSVRTSSSPGSKFEPLAEGPSNLVAITDSDDLFSLSANEDDIVTVRVIVTHGKHMGDRVVFISRKLRPQKIGVTVVPPSLPFGNSPLDRPVLLDSTYSSALHCPNAENIEVTATWTIDGAAVKSVASDSLDPSALTGPVRIGFGSGVILPPTSASVKYGVEVKFIDSVSGAVLGEGISVGDGDSADAAGAPLALINGGASSTTVPSGSQLSIAGSLQVGSSLATSSDLKFTWDCIVVAGGSDCPEALFPDEARTAQGSVASFNASFVDAEVGAKFEYLLAVSFAGGADSDASSFQVTVSADSAVAFPTSQLLAATGGLVTLSAVKAHEPLFFTPGIDALVSAAALEESKAESDPSRRYSYALFKADDDVDTNLLTEELLLANEGYWGPEKTSQPIVGLRGGMLKPGDYVLYGAINKDASPSSGSSWPFTVEKPDELQLAVLPIVKGDANVTMFHAAASSVPATRNLFYFALRPAGDDASTTITPQNCLSGCSGSRAVSFLISDEGSFEVVASMYDPSGSYLLASRVSKETISVSTASSGSGAIPSSSARVVLRQQAASIAEELTLAVNAALSQADEGTFLTAVLAFSREPSVSQRAISTAVEGLLKLASSSYPAPIRAGRIVEAAASLVEHPNARNETDIILLAKVVENVVSRGGQSAPIGDAVVPAMTRFFGRATGRLFELLKDVQSSDDAASVSQVQDIEAIAENLRDATARDMTSALSVGRECGAVDSALVPLDSLERSGFNGTTQSDGPIADEYRVAVSCYPGQISSVSGTPSTLSYLDVCPDAQAAGETIAESVRVFAWRDQYDVTAQDNATDDNLRGGALIGAATFRRDYSTGLVALLNAFVTADACYKMRVPFFGTEELGAGKDTFANNRLILCEDAGLIISSRDAEGEILANTTNKETPVSQFHFESDGRISARITTNEPTLLHMDVNSTLLAACIANSKVTGDRSSSVGLLLTIILGTPAIFLAALACIARWSFSDEDSVRQLEEKEAGLSDPVDEPYDSSPELRLAPDFSRTEEGDSTVIFFDEDSSGGDLDEFRMEVDVSATTTDSSKVVSTGSTGRSSGSQRVRRGRGSAQASTHSSFSAGADFFVVRDYYGRANLHSNQK